jgi:hypothetical protein
MRTQHNKKQDCFTFLTTVLLGLFACSDSSDSTSTADIAGTYTMSRSVQQNNCGIVAGAAGDSFEGVRVAITQSGGQATASILGAAGAATELLMGTSTFSGTVSGSSFDLALASTTAGSSGTCAYTINAHMIGSISGDAIQGKVVYTYVTNKTADCGARDTCQDIELFSGSRPPKT